jgi:hypothetical protein
VVSVVRAVRDEKTSPPKHCGPTTQRGMSPVLTRRRREASEAWRAKAKRIFE